MKPANSWPRACFPLQVAEGGTEAIRASEPSINRTRVAALGRGADARAAGQQRLTRPRRRAVVWLLALAVVALGTADALAAPRHKRVPAHPSKAAEAERHNHGSASDAKRSRAEERAESHGACGRTEHPPADCPTNRGFAAAGSLPVSRRTPVYP